MVHNAGLKVRGHTLRPALDTTRGFTEGEWLLLRSIADGIERTDGWSEAAAQRLHFLLDFGYATGLRANELVGAVLGDARIDERDNLRHASIATTSMYLHGDEVQRARQMNQAFAARKSCLVEKATS